MTKRFADQAAVRVPEDAAYDVVALFSGDPPGDGARSHQASLVAASVADPSDTELIEQLRRSRNLTALDRIIELESQATEEGRSPADEPLWLLIRIRPVIAGARVLVVEDSELNGDYYRDVLSGAGAEVEVATTASEGLDLSTEHRFDLALVDVRLPDANGYELCRMLGSTRSDRILPRLLMSADSATLDTNRVMAVGASGFVINPVRPDELTRTVAAALKADDRRIILPVGTEAADLTQQPLLRLFDRASVWSAGGWSDLPAGRSADILATLAAACPQAVSSERMSELVWDRNLTVSSNAMYTAISRLRRQLEDSLLADCIVTDGTGYRLAIAPESIDLVAFERRAKQITGEKQGATTEELGQLLERWGGDPFVGSSNELLVNWRHRLRELRAQAQELLAVHRIIAGRPGEAGRLCRDLVFDEPWRESAWSLLIVALYRAGQPNDALTAYRAAVSQLRGDLGLDPGPGLAALESQVLNHAKELQDDQWISRMATSLNRRRGPE